jgi:hypothetical protein
MAGECMSSPRHANKREVFQRIYDRLRLGMQGTPYENRIYIVCGSDMPENIRDRDYLLLRSGGGTFDSRIMQSSGPIVVPYSGTAVVEVWKNNRQDRSGISEHILLTEDSGLFEVEQTILSSLCGTLLETTDDPYQGLLTEMMFPVDDSEPIRVSDETFDERANVSMSRAVLSVTFSVKFHWQL